jgi:hypothetical protein
MPLLLLQGNKCITNFKYLKLFKLRISLVLKLVSCSACSSTVYTEAICCSETSLEFQRSTRHCIPKIMFFIPAVFRNLLTKSASNRIRRLLTMVYNTQNYWVSGLCASSGIVNTRKHSDWGPNNSVSTNVRLVEVRSRICNPIQWQGFRTIPLLITWV